MLEDKSACLGILLITTSKMLARSSRGSCNTKLHHRLPQKSGIHTSKAIRQPHGRVRGEYACNHYEIHADRH